MIFGSSCYRSGGFDKTISSAALFCQSKSHFEFLEAQERAWETFELAQSVVPELPGCSGKTVGCLLSWFWHGRSWRTYGSGVNVIMVLSRTLWAAVRLQGGCSCGSGMEALEKGSSPNNKYSQSHLSYVGKGAVFSQRRSG